MAFNNVQLGTLAMIYINVAGVAKLYNVINVIPKKLISLSLIICFSS